LGEYAALVAAEVLAFEDAVRAVRRRGDAMQDAVPVGVGAMAAVIGLDPDAVVALCETSRKGDEVLVPANFNAPGQIVVAGHRTAVERLVASASQAGARRAISLPVSAPFHCPLMRPAAERLAEFLKTLAFGKARFPVVANVDATPCAGGEDARRRLVAQVASPVRWIETMQRLETGQEVRLGVELGVGRTLAGLSRKINQELKVVPLGTPEELKKVLVHLAG